MKRRFVEWTCFVGGLASLACHGSGSGGAGGPSPDAGASDGGVITVATGCDPSKPFGAPVPIPGSDPEDESLFLTNDFLSAAFGSRRQGGYGGVDVWLATRRSTAEPFGTAKSTYSAGANERYPTLSRDLLRLYFSSDVGGYRTLIEARRPSPTAAFPDASRQIAGLDDAGVGILQHWFSADEKLLYFDGYFSAGMGESDLYAGDFGNDAVTNIRNLTTLNTPNDESAPVLTDDGLTVYFSSNRPGASPPDNQGFTWDDVWVARRSSPSVPFGPPEDVAELNSPNLHDHPVWISPEGCTLFFRRGNRYDDTLLQASRGN